MLKIIVGLIIVIGLIIAGPLITIWAANTIISPFTTASIPYAVDTWAAVIILGAFLRANVTVKRKD